MRTCSKIQDLVIELLNSRRRATIAQLDCFPLLFNKPVSVSSLTFDAWRNQSIFS